MNLLLVREAGESDGTVNIIVRKRYQRERSKISEPAFNLRAWVI
jgi:hypothetical protein